MCIYIYICIHIHMIVNHLNWVDSIKTLHLPKVCQSVRAGMCRWAWEDGTEGWAQNVGRASDAWWVEGALCPELHCITKSGEGWGKFFFFLISYPNFHRDYTDYTFRLRLLCSGPQVTAACPFSNARFHGSPWPACRGIPKNPSRWSRGRT